MAEKGWWACQLCGVGPPPRQPPWCKVRRICVIACRWMPSVSEVERRGRFAELLTQLSRGHYSGLSHNPPRAMRSIPSNSGSRAGWLMAHDRMDRHEFPLTQEFAAMMLGTTRPTVTVVAGALQKAGLIRYHRGRVTIVDRQAVGSGVV